MTNANSKAHKQKKEVSFQEMINLNEEQAVKDLSADAQSLIEKTA